MNSTPPRPTRQPVRPAPPAGFDLLADLSGSTNSDNSFGDFNSCPMPKENASVQPGEYKGNLNNLFDPFGTSANENLLGGWNDYPKVPVNNAAGESESTNFFAGLGMIFTIFIIFISKWPFYTSFIISLDLRYFIIFSK